MLARNELRTDILKALANLTRVCIVERLRDGPLNVGELSEKLGESPSSTSRHLGLMRKAGLIEVEKQGTTVVYSLGSDRIPNILGSIDEVIKVNAERYKAFFD